MRYHALVCDYDGTIAHDGRVTPTTVAALERLSASGRRLVLVTGRELDDLRRAFDRVDIFDLIVAENGGLLFDSKTRQERLLTDPPDPRLVDRLQGAGVDPLSVGRTIVATWEPNQTVVLDAIRDLGLELEVIFNKGAVMVLPTGITKASGLHAALADLGLSSHNAVGVGDAQNDHAFLISCEVSAAVANALETVKEDADLVLHADHGAGVEELVERLLDDDLASLDDTLARQRVAFSATDAPFAGPISTREKVVVAGASGGGKSTLVTAFVERLAERAYQYCLVDPEGDYEDISGPVRLGRADRAPTVDEVMDALDQPDRSVVVDLLGVRIEERPAFFDSLLGQLLALRLRTGRPHWIVVDEAHHLVPEGWQPKASGIDELAGMVLVTVHPERMASAIAGSLDLVVAVGENAAETIRSTATMLDVDHPAVPSLQEGQAVLWRPHPPAGDRAVVAFEPAAPSGERQRHRRKYAEGHLGPDKSFWFRGPEGRLELQAQNLELFLQIGDGVDDETWLHHLRAGEYSRWIRDAIKDDDLAEAIAAVEEDEAVDSTASRQRVRDAVESRYAVGA